MSNKLDQLLCEHEMYSFNHSHRSKTLILTTCAKCYYTSRSALIELGASEEYKEEVKKWLSNE